MGHMQDIEGPVAGHRFVRSAYACRLVGWFLFAKMEKCTGALDFWRDRRKPEEEPEAFRISGERKK